MKNRTEQLQAEAAKRQADYHAELMQNPSYAEGYRRYVKRAGVNAERLEALRKGKLVRMP